MAQQSGLATVQIGSAKAVEPDDPLGALGLGARPRGLLHVVIVAPAKPRGLRQSGTAPPQGRARGVIVAVGDASQAELVHARLAPLVNRLLWTFLGCDAERDDVAHDIFVKILRGVQRVRDPARLEAWAMRVSMNTIKNEFRRRRLRRFLALDVVSEAEHPHFHPDFEGRELLRRTHAILEALPVAERLAVTLRLIDQASAERIAEVCGFSERTAKRRLASGRERFLRLARRDPLLMARLQQDFPLEESDDA